jgi:hypothetical protein
VCSISLCLNIRLERSRGFGGVRWEGYCPARVGVVGEPRLGMNCLSGQRFVMVTFEFV